MKGGVLFCHLLFLLLLCPRDFNKLVAHERANYKYRNQLRSRKLQP